VYGFILHVLSASNSSTLFGIQQCQETEIRPIVCVLYLISSLMMMNYDFIDDAV
jgi:hypothetical protein